MARISSACVGVQIDNATVDREIIFADQGCVIGYHAGFDRLLAIVCLHLNVEDALCSIRVFHLEVDIAVAYLDSDFLGSQIRLDLDILIS